MSKVKNRNGYELDYEVAISYMDDGIREELCNNFLDETDQEFFSAYEIEHEKE